MDPSEDTAATNEENTDDITVTGLCVELPRVQVPRTSLAAWVMALGVHAMGLVAWIELSKVPDPLPLPSPPISLDVVVEHPLREAEAKVRSDLSAVLAPSEPTPLPSIAPPAAEPLSSPPVQALPEVHASSNLVEAVAATPLLPAAEAKPESNGAVAALPDLTAAVPPSPTVTGGPKDHDLPEARTSLQAILPTSPIAAELGQRSPQPLSPTEAAPEEVRVTALADPVLSTPVPSEPLLVPPPDRDLLEERPSPHSISPRAPNVAEPRQGPPPQPLSPSEVVPDTVPITALGAPLSSAPAQHGSEPIPVPPADPPEAARIAPSTPVAEPNVVALVPAPLPIPAQTADPQRQLQDSLQSFECGRVEANVTEDGETVQLKGHLSSAAERTRLIEQVSGIAGLRKIVDRDLYVVGEPYCHVLSFLGQPWLAQSTDQRFGPGAVGQPAQSGVVRFTGGMPLELQLVTPTFPSYIRVDYFTSDGQVYHLLPGGGSPDQPLAPNLKVTVGGAKGRGLKARIGPPYGLDLVVALASDQRLTLGTRPAAESGHGYLRALQSAVERVQRENAESRLEFSYYLVLTAPH
ncbi:DUF4384 domain-containing protein [Microvirga pakistanensis]|uniref:DUF4384 domain-containing protein n=1 Tax=Microvirga pakistanensis TaxID=1682650 RepID=UPI00141ABA70|nr:DUF4384 domain-containing protein [Microvirga pakistanensis]